MASNLTRIDPKTLNVGIIGYTGGTGRMLTFEIFKNNIFKSVVLIGRRLVNYEEEFMKNATQKVIDFDKITECDDVFKGLDVVYCCLGTTRAKSNPEQYKKIEYDYTVGSAKVAIKNGCKQFHLVTSAGADKNSMFTYLKTKGITENAIGELGFQKAAMYRAKYLHGPREEKRTDDSIMRPLMAPFLKLAPTLLTTPLETLAKSMIANTIYEQSNGEKLDIVENARIFKLAELYNQEKP